MGLYIKMNIYASGFCLFESAKTSRVHIKGRGGSRRCVENKAEIHIVEDESCVSQLFAGHAGDRLYIFGQEEGNLFNHCVRPL